MRAIAGHLLRFVRGLFDQPPFVSELVDDGPQEIGRLPGPGPFPKNRLNVAISRAGCLAYLVCTDQLLDSKGRDVQKMRLISTLYAFAESSEARGRPATPGPPVAV